jgi:hypothetical protein
VIRDDIMRQNESGKIARREWDADLSFGFTGIALVSRCFS